MTMNHLVTISLFFLFVNPMFSQAILIESVKSGNIITLFKDADLSNLLHPKLNNDYNRIYNGIIGNKYKRIQLFFSSIEKTENPYVYFVEGKSKVGENVFPFIGEIVLTNAEKTSDEILDKETALERGSINGFIKGNYVFRETSKEKSTGLFKGELELNWGLDNKGNIVSSYTDNYVAQKNTIVYKGIWESYNSGSQLICCWSDYKIPCVPKDFDVSNGPDIIPNEKYSDGEWENLRIIYTKSENTPEWKKAYEEEMKKWWE